MSYWTDDRVEMLKKLHADGLSAAMIARELGDGISRNAVISKLFRSGLTNGGHPSVPIPRKPRVIDNSDADPHFATDGITGQPDVLDLEIPVEQRRTLLGPPHGAYLVRGDRDCAWPVGEPKDAAFFFCGAARSGDEPYCTHHCRRAYNGAMSRRRAA